MLINKQNIAELIRNIKTTFQKKLESIKGQWQDTTMLVQSSGAENDYKWLTNFPKMREWIGEKVVNALKANKYVRPNRPWESTIEVDRDDVEDGAFGSIQIQSELSAEAAGEFYDDLDADLKNNAFVDPCFDGQPFYDTDHPVEGKDGQVTSVSNRLTAALSAADLASAEASFGAAEVMLMNMTRDGGHKLGLMPAILEVPSQLKATAKLLMESDKLQDGTPNPYKGSARVKVNPRLESATQWMLHAERGVAKPFIIQERKKPVPVSQVDPDSDNVFMRRKFLFSVEARATNAYGFWQLSIGSTGAG